MKKLILFYLLLLPVYSLFSQEYTVTSVPNPKTYDATNFVSNPDAILSGEAVLQINGMLQSLESDTKAEVAVVVVNSIGYEDIKDFAVRLFEEWGVGKTKLDNGLLILFVLDQRKITFETGYGLEGVLPDAICKRIQTQAMLPEFKAGDYDAGFIAGVEKVSSVIRKEPVPELEEKIFDWKSVLPMVAGFSLLFALLAFLWMNGAANSVKKNPKLKDNVTRYSVLKNKRIGVIATMAFVIPICLFIIIFFIHAFEYLLYIIPMPFMVIPAAIFGKSQMTKVRKQSIPCDACGGTMNLLSEKEEERYQNKAQILEENLGSVDYDVFVCDKCDKHVIYRYDKSSRYSKCPRCGTKSFAQAGSRIIKRSTYTQEGIEEITYKCKYCGYEENKQRRLPKKENTGAIIGGAAAGSILGGGGRGGGFGGGGSFGGGRSGGGGATSGW